MTDFEDATIEEQDVSVEGAFMEVKVRTRLLATMMEKALDTLRVADVDSPEGASWEHVNIEMQRDWNAAAFAMNGLCAAYETLAYATTR